MTNFEALIKNNPQYVKEILAHHIFESDLEKAINDIHKRYAWYNTKHTADEYGMKFLNKEYVQPALDEVEKRYLSNVIAPFKHNVRYIKKTKMGDWYYIAIRVQSECMALPNFSSKSKMYQGMELEKAYTLKELGL